MKLSKTRHFRLDNDLEQKLLLICSAKKKKPSETIRELIMKERVWTVMQESK